MLSAIFRIQSMTISRNESIEWANIRFVPILHNRMEFALEVKRQFQEFQPDCIAVEFADTLKKQIIRGIKRLPLLSVVHYEQDEGEFIYLVIEPTDGQVEAIRLGLSHALPVHFIDHDTDAYPLDNSPMPDPYSLTRIGHYQYCQAYLRSHMNTEMSHQDILREKTMAFHLQNLNKKNKRIMFIGGLFHLPGILNLVQLPQTEVIGRRYRKGVEIAHLHQESSREILSEMPFLSARYEQYRVGKDLTPLPDRMDNMSELIDIATKNHHNNTKEELSYSQLKILHKFARNYTLLSGQLAPSFYRLIVAARGAADDNFAYEVWKKGSDYPWQTNNPDIPVLHLKGEDLFLDHRKIKFHRRLKGFRRRLVPMPVRKRPRENYPGEWKADFNESNICSHPPEDIVIEGYGRHLMKRALEIKAEENCKIVQFTASMLDGLDIRQTMRDLPSGKIYVKENRQLRGKVGSVVVIFDPDIPNPGGKECFPWKVTWLGEHDQESDMAFYSTSAGEVMDGPGITRCQYGGFMLTYPPLRVYDIWRDDFFNTARNKPERLLMAAIDYCLEKHVVYVAKDPPSGWCLSLASKLSKKIIYLPIGIFSPVILRKIRQFHVLKGHHVRRYSHQYIS